MVAKRSSGADYGDGRGLCGVQGAGAESVYAVLEFEPVGGGKSEGGGVRGYCCLTLLCVLFFFPIPSFRFLLF